MDGRCKSGEYLPRTASKRWQSRTAGRDNPCLLEDGQRGGWAGLDRLPLAGLAAQRVRVRKYGHGLFRHKSRHTFTNPPLAVLMAQRRHGTRERGIWTMGTSCTSHYPPSAAHPPRVLVGRGSVAVPTSPEISRSQNPSPPGAAAGGERVQVRWTLVPVKL